MKAIIYAAVFLLLLFSVSGIDCDLTKDKNYCEQVKNSNLSETEKDQVFSSLLYSNNNYPNHTFIENYNLNIKVTEPPENTKIQNSRIIKNAWFSFLAVFPSVYENDTLYISEKTKVLSEYSYNTQVPSSYQGSRPFKEECRRTYELTSNDAKVRYYLNGIYKGEGKSTEIQTNEDGILKAELTITTNIKVKHYDWNAKCCTKYGCKSYCDKCIYSYTSYERDNLKITEEKEIRLYTKKPSAHLIVTDKYLDTTKGDYWANNYSFFKLSFSDSYIEKQQYHYDLVFDKKPYYFAYLNAQNFSHMAQKNIYLDNSTFFVNSAQNCSIFAYNHFYNFTSECDLTLHQENVKKLEIKTQDIDLTLVIYVVVFLSIAYIIYRILKSQFRKIVIPVLFAFLVVGAPFVAAVEEEECGLTNLASCIPQKIYEYLLVVINAPLLPLLAAIEKLLTADISIELFFHLWNVIRYILSFFYVFLFIYAGYIFLTSNANPIRRAQAKDMLKDTLLMIVLIQGSFYIYGLLLDISVVLNSAIISMIDPHFFLLTADNIINVGLEFLMSFTYGITLFITMLMLVLRYIVVSFGVVLFPVGIFCYFIPPLKSWGKFVLNVLGVFIFVAFFDLLIILGCSLLIESPVFENFKIAVMITCFGIVNYTLWLAVKFSLNKSTDISVKDDLMQAAKYIAMLA